MVARRRRDCAAGCLDRRRTGTAVGVRAPVGRKPGPLCRGRRGDPRGAARGPARGQALGAPTGERRGLSRASGDHPARVRGHIWR